tara:strand:- start:63 stop:491 length:429 start_codon:yes stop_codon:yes gene_type:complete
MRLPLIVITYGFTPKLCSWEDNGIHKLPFFNEPLLAQLFLDSYQNNMGELLKGKEPLQIQLCQDAQHALDMMKIVGTVAPDAQIIFNAAPLVENPEEVIQKVAGQFQDIATVINKEYDIEEATEIINELVQESKSGPDSNSE